MSTSFKTILHNFSDKAVHPASGTHDHHEKVLKAVYMRKAVDNKLLVDDVAAAVRLIMSVNSTIKLSPETIEALCPKHHAVSADIRQVPIPDIPYERDVSGTEINETQKTL